MIISDHLVRGSEAPCFGHARRDAGCPAVGGLVWIVWFFGQFRSLVRPGGRAWLMLRLGPHDSGVWLFAGTCYLYKARLRRKPSWLPVALIHNEVKATIVIASSKATALSLQEKKDILASIALLLLFLNSICSSIISCFLLCGTQK